MSAVRATITVVTATATVTLDPLARNPVAVDAGRAADVLVRVVQYRRAPTDQAGAADAARRALGKTLADAAGATDDLNGALAGDDQTIEFAKGLGEVPVVADTRRADLAKPVADAGRAGDAAALAMTKPAQDAAAAQDALARLVQYRRDLPEVYATEYFAEDYTATDKALAFDLYTLAAGKALTETARALDVLARDAGKPLAHAAGAADALRVLGVGRPLADAAATADLTVRGFGAVRAHGARTQDAGALAMPDSYSAGYFAADYCGALRTW